MSFVELYWVPQIPIVQLMIGCSLFTQLNIWSYKRIKIKNAKTTKKKILTGKQSFEPLNAKVTYNAKLLTAVYYVELVSVLWKTSDKQWSWLLTLHTLVTSHYSNSLFRWISQIWRQELQKCYKYTLHQSVFSNGASLQYIWKHIHSNTKDGLDKSNCHLTCKQKTVPPFQVSPIKHQS